MSTDRPMSSAEAAAFFAEERRRFGPVSAMMEEAKTDIESIVAMVNMASEKGIRRAKAREFAKAFELPDSTIPNIETLFYGDVEARVQAGRELWKVCDEIQKKSRAVQGRDA